VALRPGVRRTAARGHLLRRAGGRALPGGLYVEPGRRRAAL